MFKIRIRDIEVEYIVDYRDVKYVRYELARGVLKLILPKHFREMLSTIFIRRIIGFIIKYWNFISLKIY